VKRSISRFIVHMLISADSLWFSRHFDVQEVDTKSQTAARRRVNSPQDMQFYLESV